MICKRQGEGWDFIFQRNHALLAAQMLADWKAEHRPEPWFELLNACAQHDHGWKEDERDSLLDDDGQPLDFLHVAVPTSIAISQENLANAEAQSRWCAILAAKHIEYLSSFKSDPRLSSLIETTRRRRLAWMAEIEVGPEDLEPMYELLCWADSLSLLVCCQPSAFTESLELVAQGQIYSSHQIGPDVWSLAPWPFRAERLRLSYEVRHVARARFESVDQLRSQLAQATVALRQVELVGDSP